MCVSAFACDVLGDSCQLFPNDTWQVPSLDGRLTLSPHPSNHVQFLAGVPYGGSIHACACDCVSFGWNVSVALLERQIRQVKDLHHPATEEFVRNDTIPPLAEGLNLVSTGGNFPGGICNITVPSLSYPNNTATRQGNRDKGGNAVKLSVVYSKIAHGGPESVANRSAGACNGTGNWELEPSSNSAISAQNDTEVTELGISHKKQPLDTTQVTSLDSNISYLAPSTVVSNISNIPPPRLGAERSASAPQGLPLILYDNSPISGSAIALFMILLVILMVAIILAMYSK